MALRSSRLVLILIALVFVFSFSRSQAQSPGNEAMPPAPHGKQIHLKHVLVISQTKGFEHDSVSDAMAAIYNIGR